VDAEITEPGFADLRTDAGCEIRPQSLIGEYYVDCQPGHASRRLPQGGTVPVEQTSSTIPMDVVNDIWRRPYRERFRLIVAELGTGLAGRPDDLQEVLRRAHPGLRESSRTLQMLAAQNEVIKNFITDSDTVITALEARKRDVTRFIREAGETAQVTASRRGAVRAGLRRLPTFLDELRPTMTRLGELADEQTPLLADLRRAAPSIDTFFTRVGPFADAARPAVDSLGEAGEVGTRAFRKGREEIAQLRQLSGQARPFARPLRQFLGTLDDRRRAIEDDPRAVATAPPAPDPTAISDHGGFTGLEALWNYFYWQTLSVNMLDSTSHMLRASLSAAPDCLNFRNTPPQSSADRATFERCNSYLGPNQPGIFSPDPLDDGGNPQAAALRAASGRPGGRPGEQRGEGQPEAGPLPGQPDLSRPQVALPPDVQDLLDSLTPRERRRLPVDPKDLPDLTPRELDNTLDELQNDLGGALPQVDPGNTGPLLDYLLAP